VCLSQALEAAGIAIEKDHIDNVDKMRAGILIGTAMGGMATFAQAIEDLTQKVQGAWIYISLQRSVGTKPRGWVPHTRCTVLPNVSEVFLQHSVPSEP